MATATVKWYLQGKKHVAAGDIDWDANTVKAQLCSSSYVPNQDTDEFRSSVTNEVTGTNWAAGGVALSNKSVATDATSNEVRWIADDISNATTTLTGAQVVVIYKSTGAAATDILLGYAVLDSALSPNAGTLTLNWDSAAAHGGAVMYDTIAA